MTALAPDGPQFRSGAELLRHYDEVRARLLNPRPVVGAPKPPEPPEPDAPAPAPAARPEPHLAVDVRAPRAPGEMGVEDEEPSFPRDPNRERDWIVLAPRVLMAEIFEAVCRHYDVSSVDVLSQRREKRVMRPRLVVYYLCHKLTIRSVTQIGQFLGGRDHTSILSGLKRVEKLISDGDDALAADIDEIARRLTRGRL